jgi:hypothetical protein
MCYKHHASWLNNGDLKDMTKSAKLVSLSAAALLGVSLLGGCATDQTARDMAQQAMDTANAAQSCCNANTERLDRMYQKIMGK